MKGTIAALGAVLLASACHAEGAARPAWTQTETAKRAAGPIAGFDRADVVAFERGRAVFYAIGAKKLEEVGRADIGSSGVVTTGWANRDELYVNGMDREVLRITAAGVSVVEVPPIEAFEIKPPPDVDDLEDLGWEELAVDDSGVWYGVCPWGESGDPGQCNQWVWIRLDGSGEKKLGGERGRKAAFPDATPPGFELEKHKIEGRFDTLTCSAPDGTVEMFNPSESGWGNAIVASHWVSVEPPTLLVEMGYANEYQRGETTHWELYRGCDEPVAQGLTVAPGAGELWVGMVGDYDEVAHPVIFRGAMRIGGLRHGAIVSFRPPA